MPDIKICGLKYNDLCTSVYYISCDLHRSPNIVTTNSKQLQQTCHAVTVDVQCNAFKISIGKTLLRVLTQITGEETVRHNYKNLTLRGRKMGNNVVMTKD